LAKEMAKWLIGSFLKSYGPISVKQAQEVGLALIPETVCYAVSSSNAQRHIVVPSEMDDRLDGQIAEISSLVQQQYIFSYGRFGTKLVTLDHTFI
jgi:hypothetical protein